MIGILNAIRIDMDPDMLTLGSFVLTWHGFFTFVGVAMAVALSVLLGQERKYPAGHDSFRVRVGNPGWHRWRTTGPRRGLLDRE